MKVVLRLMLFAMSFLIAQAGFAQSKTITGRVTSSDDGSPLIGVSVVVKGTTNGASTDIDGAYSIEAAPGSVLVFSYIGMIAQEQTVGTASTINVSMRSDAKVMDEVVVVGYGTQMKSNVTGAITTVDTKVLESRPITDVARGLQGTVPGLTITTPSGQIGQAPTIRLRANTGTLTGGGAQPLILVDNVEIQAADLQLINPEDIESMSVLKDAASASIYGARGAWGVVLITTKSGKKGSPTRVTYSNNLAWSSPLQMPQLASAADNGEMALKAQRRANPALEGYSVIGNRIDEIAIQKMREWDQLYGGQDLGPEMVMGRDFEIRDGFLFFYRSWDVGDIMMRDWTPQQKHDISVTGGSEKTSYNLSLGYLGQEGTLKVNPDQFNRYNVNVGVNTSATKWLDVRAKVLYSNSLLTDPYNFGPRSAYDPWYYLYRWPANFPYGTYNGQPFRNAVTDIAQAKMNEHTNALTRINLGSTIKPMEGLTVDVSYTYTGRNGNTHQTGGRLTGIDFWSRTPVRNPDGTFDLPAPTAYSDPVHDLVRYQNRWSHLNTGKAFATYVKDINSHSFKIITGADVDYFQDWEVTTTKQGLMTTGVGEFPLANGAVTANNSRGHWSNLGYFGRINYSFKDKYLLELNGRYDGSSRLAPGKKWGFFPSMSAGYVISEEPFMEFARPFVSFLKFRGSWGSIGNQAVSASSVYRTLPQITNGGLPVSNWVVGGINLQSVNAPGAFAEGLTWETITTLDFGVDTRFFNDRFGIAFDWYKRNTTDMFSAGVPLPSTFGTSAPRRNFGELETKGWELAVDFKHSFGNGLNINSTAILSDYKERIVTYPGTRQISGNYEGRILGEIWGYETDRLFTEDDFQRDPVTGELIRVRGAYVPNADIADQTLLTTGAFRFGPGDVKYRDLNGDGKISNGANTVEDPGDMKVIGNTTPRYQYGLRFGADWKGVDFNLFLQGVGSRDYWATGPIAIPGWRVNESWYAHHTDYWTPENPGAFYPAPNNQNQAATTNFYPQSRYLLNLAYLRLKNLAVGYTVPQVLTRQFKIERLRIYVSGENLATFDKLGNVPIDPEVNITPAAAQWDPSAFGRSYPYMKAYSFGVQITL